MKIFISSDMEGTAGITCWDETQWEHPRSEYFRAQMSREVAAACEGALEAGAEDVLVKDAHDSARNIDPLSLPEKARILRAFAGHPLSMMVGLDTDRFEAVAFTGYHSGAGCSGNPLSHTMHRFVEEIRLNGESVSEFVINALIAAYYHIPVAFLSGDKALCEYAEGWIPGITTVATNTGLGSSTISISPKKAVGLIREKMREALTGNFAACVVPLPERFDIQVRLNQHTMAFKNSFYPGAKLLEPKTIGFSSHDYFEVLRFFHFVL